MPPIILRYADNFIKPYVWVLHEDIYITLSDEEILVIPKGFETDLATVPRFLWSLIPPWGRANIAFIIHDYLYDEQDARGRKFADDEMLHWMLKEGQPKVRSYLMYWGVRWFAKRWWVS